MSSCRFQNESEFLVSVRFVTKRKRKRHILKDCFGVFFAPKLRSVWNIYFHHLLSRSSRSGRLLWSNWDSQRCWQSSLTVQVIQPAVDPTPDLPNLRTPILCLPVIPCFSSGSVSCLWIIFLIYVVPWILLGVPWTIISCLPESLIVSNYPWLDDMLLG